MIIAFTHNLRTAPTEAQAEFDSSHTVELLTEALTRLGHEVHRVDAGEPVSQFTARLERLRPDLVFNTAEGTLGRYREAFFPALFDQLRLPYTGSDAHVCAVTLDKQETKRRVMTHGVPTPRSYFWDGSGSWEPPSLAFPVIVKPNFEGSSKGIRQESVVENASELHRRAEALVRQYDSGLLIEEFVEGRDVTVPYLEALGGPDDGVLPSASYAIDRRITANRRWTIYDYELKNDLADAVEVSVPADVSPSVSRRLHELSSRCIRALGLCDFARFDFRVTPDDEVYFIEVNALPSLEPGASIYESAALRGLDSVESVLDAIISSATRRQNVVPRRSDTPAPLRIGLTYNLKRVDPRSESDVEAEYDSPQTVRAIREALEAGGHEVVEVEATRDLLTALPAAAPDAVFNVAEGSSGRNREAQVPAILEFLNIPYTGSDPATLAITLDKGLAKRLVREAGLATPRFAVCSTVEDVDRLDLAFPVIAKPDAEGSSKGVTPANVCTGTEELRRRVTELTAKYGQRVLVEEFLPGREFTIGILADPHPYALPPMEIVFEPESGDHPVYGYGHKHEIESGVRLEVPAAVDADLRRALSEHALAVFEALGCRDVARIDVRLDASGRPNFIECNPLPGLTPGWSDLCHIAMAAGIDYTSLIGAILAPALRRMREVER
jgi:D-alanine-D-alanine ligase